MKKILSSLLSTIILLSVLQGTIHAQDIIAGISNAEFTGMTDEARNGDRLKSAEINTNAIKNFEKSFKQAKNVNWYKVKDGFMVYFYQNETKEICGYDLKGRWQYTLVSYPEKKLPLPIWHRVKTVYYEYAITWVNQIQIQNKIIYVVHLENENTYKNVRVTDEDMDIIEEVEKK
ncbi:MAG: hypothetical protein JST09_18015 [Bacteroidetes bacterium]|nr:hypothetical protein [Bacteroidota bacterium]MBS1611165.1 hypothetical protein [Bacteroidota bacterium]